MPPRLAFDRRCTRRRALSCAAAYVVTKVARACDRVTRGVRPSGHFRGRVSIRMADQINVAHRLDRDVGGRGLGDPVALWLVGEFQSVGQAT